MNGIYPAQEAEKRTADTCIRLTSGKCSTVANISITASKADGEATVSNLFMAVPNVTKRVTRLRTKWQTIKIKMNSFFIFKFYAK